MFIKEDLAKIVGDKRIFDDTEKLEKYASDESFESPGMPWCIAAPEDAEQVQKLVQWANEKMIPLIPVSSPGGPRRRGDTIPTQGGVIVDLSGMNKILDIDRKNKVAVIEPGVTFEQLETELKKNGMKVLKPLLPRNNKSVLASCLEREPIVVPKQHWDALDPLICIEVVFGTGDIFRTGSAAGPGTVEEQMKAGNKPINPIGPSSADLSRVVQGAQGTLGIVTWGSVVCGLIPAMEKTFLIGSKDLSPLIDLTYKVAGERFGEEVFLINGFTLANMVANEKEEIRKLSAELPSWILLCNLTAPDYFPEEKVAYQEKDLLNYAQALGLDPQTSMQGISGQTLMKMLETPPDPHHKMKYKGGCQDIFFTTTLDKTQNFIDDIYDGIDQQQYPLTDIGIYLQPMVQGCSCHCEFSFFYDPENNTEKETIKTYYADLSKGLARSGAFFGRPYGQWADMVYSMMGENAAALRKVKNIFDPKGIMNPGKLCY